MPDGVGGKKSVENGRKKGSSVGENRGGKSDNRPWGGNLSCKSSPVKRQIVQPPMSGQKKVLRVVGGPCGVG